MSHLRMVCGFLVISGLGMPCGLAMVLRRVLVVIRRYLMMFMNIVTIHRRLPVDGLLRL